jgi:hypothetical protein
MWVDLQVQRQKQKRRQSRMLQTAMLEGEKACICFDTTVVHKSKLTTLPATQCQSQQRVNNQKKRKKLKS